MGQIKTNYDKFLVLMMCHKTECRCAGYFCAKHGYADSVLYWVYSIVSAHNVSVFVPNVVMLSVIILRVNMLTVFILSVVMLCHCGDCLSAKLCIAMLSVCLLSLCWELLCLVPVYILLINTECCYFVSGCWLFMCHSVGCHYDVCHGTELIPKQEY